MFAQARRSLSGSRSISTASRSPIYVSSPLSLAVPESYLNGGTLTCAPLAFVTSANLPSPFRLGHPRSWMVSLAWTSSSSLRCFSSLFSDSKDPQLHQGKDKVEDVVARKETWLGNLLSRSPDSATTEDFLVVLRALAQSRLPDAAVRADRWMYRLEQHDGFLATSNAASFKHKKSTVSHPAVPNAECYQRVMEAWSDAMSEDPARVVTRAERWLWKHVDSPSLSLRPNTACFNAFLDACTRGRSYRGSKHTTLQRKHAEKAEAVLEYMINRVKQEGPESCMAPDTESFNLVLRGWTRDRRSTRMTECTSRVFQRLEEYHRCHGNDVRPNSKTYHMLMDSISVRAKLKVKNCRSGTVDPHCNGLEEISLLKNMLEFLHEQQQQGNQHLGPTTYAYNMLLSCWANIASMHDGATTEAEAIRRHMTTLKDQGKTDVGPDATSYLLVLRAWANCNKDNRGARVEWLLSSQWNDFDFTGDANLRPTVDAYNLVIRVWASLHQPQRAEKVLTELLNLAAESTDDSRFMRPTSESFALLIRAWTTVANHQGSASALMRAAEWLQTLVKRETTGDPNLVSSVDLFSSILGAARKCASLDVLDVAVQVFKLLQKSHHTVEPIHYSRLIQTGLLALSRPENSVVRASFVRHLLQECQEAGLVSSPLLQALANGPVFSDGWTAQESEELLLELFPDWPLPPSWTRNVRQPDLLPQKRDLLRRSNMYRPATHGVDPYKHESDSGVSSSHPRIGGASTK